MGFVTELQCASEIVGQLLSTMNNHWRDYQNSINCIKDLLYCTNLIIMAIILIKSVVIAMLMFNSHRFFCGALMAKLPRDHLDVCTM
jgi:hypothetical protein